MSETISLLLKNKKTILVNMVVLLGIIAGIYLIREAQVLKSRAEQDLSGSFSVSQVKDGQDQGVNCNGETCNVSSLDVNIKVKDLNNLNNQ